MKRLAATFNCKGRLPLRLGILRYNPAFNPCKTMDPGGDDHKPTAEEMQKELRQEVLTEVKTSAKRGAAGCLGTLVGVFLAAILLTLFFSPWAFYIGNRFTPSASWEGYGRLHSSTGTDYGLYLHLSEYSRTGRHSVHSSNLRGTAALCTPLGTSYEYNLDGRIDDVWLYTEGKQTRLSLETPSGDKSKRGFELTGTWRDGRLALADQGSLGKPFHADGSLDPKGHYNPNPIKGEHAEVTVSFGSRFEFDELCANGITGKAK